MRTPGVVLGLALLALAAWWYASRPALAAQSSAEPPPAPRTNALPDRVSAAPSGKVSPATPPGAAGTPAGTEDIDPRAIKARLLVAQARQTLGKAYERTAAGGDFALAPGRILRTFLEKRCGHVQRYAEELTPWRTQLGLGGEEGVDLCQSLLFSHLKEHHGLPDWLTAEELFLLLNQIDAEYARLVSGNPQAASDEGFRAAAERFRQARRELVSPELDRKLFGLSDDLLQLPSRVSRIARDSGASPEQRLAAWKDVLRQLEEEHHVQLSSVVEPVELARHELRIREADGPLTPEEQRAVLERYTSPESAQRHLEHQQAQQSRAERLKAFNAEREQRLAQLTAQGLTPEQLRERMPQIDQQLFTKYQLQ